MPCEKHRNYRPFDSEYWAFDSAYIPTNWTDAEPLDSSEGIPFDSGIAFERTDAIIAAEYDALIGRFDSSAIPEQYRSDYARYFRAYTRRAASDTPDKPLGAHSNRALNALLFS